MSKQSLIPCITAHLWKQTILPFQLLHFLSTLVVIKQSQYPHHKTLCHCFAHLSVSALHNYEWRPSLLSATCQYICLFSSSRTAFIPHIEISLSTVCVGAHVHVYVCVYICVCTHASCCLDFPPHLGEADKDRQRQWWRCYINVSGMRPIKMYILHCNTT